MSLQDFFDVCPDPFRWENILSVGNCAATLNLSKGTGPSMPLNENDADKSFYEEFIEGVIYRVDLESETEKTLGEYINDVANIKSLLMWYDGNLVYEKYFSEEQTVDSTHFMFSVTKSLLGMVAVDLVAKGLINLDKTVDHYLEGILNSEAFSGDDVTVGMVLDMTNRYVSSEGLGGTGQCDSINFTLMALSAETQEDFNMTLVPGCEFFGAYNFADHFISVKEEFNNTRVEEGLEPGYMGPLNKLDLINMLERGNETNGRVFYYSTPSVDVMAMIINKVLKDSDSLPNSATEYFEEIILAKVGVDHDFIITLDGAKDPNWGRGGSATARDMTRLGIMLANDGKNHMGEQVLSPAAVNYIYDGSDDARKAFVYSGNFINHWSDVYGFFDGKCKDCENLGWSYNAYFRSFNPSHKEGGGEITYMEGFFGQTVWIDRKAKLVIMSFTDNSEGEGKDYMISPYHALSKAFRGLKDYPPSGSFVTRPGTFAIGIIAITAIILG